jgi:Uncharacterised protein family (UPF0236)
MSKNKEKGTFFLYSSVCRQNIQKEKAPMKQNTIKLPTLKEIESNLFRTLQETFSDVLEELLTGYDREIAEQRDKGRYQLKDKRAIQMDTLFGSVSIKRNYYWDRIGNKYVYLLDQYLQFEGGKGLVQLWKKWRWNWRLLGRHTDMHLLR